MQMSYCIGSGLILCVVLMTCDFFFFFFFLFIHD